jgi:hypothetical protein
VYYALVVFFGFVALSAAAFIFGPPEPSTHIAYASTILFVAATAGLIVSTVLAVQHRGAKKAVTQQRTTAKGRPADPTQREIGKGNS